MASGLTLRAPGENVEPIELWILRICISCAFTVHSRVWRSCVLVFLHMRTQHHSGLERLEELQVLLPRFTNGIWAANPENSLRKTFIPNLSSSACVLAMWRELIWVIWDEIKAKYKVVTDSDSVVNVLLYIVCGKKLVLFLFLDKTVDPSFNMLQYLMCVFFFLIFLQSHTAA